MFDKERDAPDMKFSFVKPLGPFLGIIPVFNLELLCFDSRADFRSGNGSNSPNYPVQRIDVIDDFIDRNSVKPRSKHSI